MQVCSFLSVDRAACNSALSHSCIVCVVHYCDPECERRRIIQSGVLQLRELRSWSRRGIIICREWRFLFWPILCATQNFQSAWFFRWKLSNVTSAAIYRPAIYRCLQYVPWCQLCSFSWRSFGRLPYARAGTYKRVTRSAQSTYRVLSYESYDRYILELAFVADIRCTKYIT